MHRFRTTRRSRVLGSLLGLALLVSSCQGARQGGPGRTAEAPPASANDINPAPREELQDGGTLRWPLEQMPPNFNLNQLDGALGDNSAIMGALMPAPFDFDASAQPILKTEYTEFAELTATDPKQVVTYRINPKAIWYDGTPITVADFEAQWRARNGTNPAFKVVSTQGYDKVESVVKGRDDREVIVTFREPYADWRGLFSGLYPASTNRDPGVFNDGWKDRPLTTAGPFKFESIDRTAQTVILARNEKWWGRPAKLERIIYRAIDPDAHIDALANGEIDFIDIASDVNKLRRAETAQGIALRKAGGPNFRHITINGTSEVLRDVKVRQALALGINREAIAEAMLGPLGVPAVPLNNHIFMANQRGYQDNAGALARYDPERARALLDEAGWRLEGPVRTKDGRPLAIRFVIPSQVATSKQEAELVQAMLTEVGARVDIQTVPTGDLFDTYVTPGDFDVTVFSWLGTVFPISSSKSIYAKPKIGPDGTLDVQQNYARVGSDEIDRLYDQATAEFDADKAIQLAGQIDALIWQEVHSLTLYQRPEIIAVTSGLANFGAFGFASTLYEDIGFVQPPQ